MTLNPPVYLCSHSSGSNVFVSKVRQKNKFSPQSHAVLAVQSDGIYIYDLPSQSLLSSIKIGSSFDPSCRPASFIQSIMSPSSSTYTLTRKTFVSNSASKEKALGQLLIISESLSGDGTVLSSPAQRLINLEDLNLPGSSRTISGLEAVELRDGHTYVAVFVLSDEGTCVILFDPEGNVIDRLTTDIPSPLAIPSCSFSSAQLQVHALYPYPNSFAAILALQVHPNILHSTKLQGGENRKLGAVSLTAIEYSGHRVQLRYIGHVDITDSEPVSSDNQVQVMEIDPKGTIIVLTSQGTLSTFQIRLSANTSPTMKQYRKPAILTNIGDTALVTLPHPYTLISSVVRDASSPNSDVSLLLFNAKFSVITHKSFLDVNHQKNIGVNLTRASTQGSQVLRSALVQKTRGKKRVREDDEGDLTRFPASPNATVRVASQCTLHRIFDEDDWSFTDPELRQVRLGAPSTVFALLDVQGTGNKNVLWLQEISVPSEDTAAEGIVNVTGSSKLTNNYILPNKALSTLDERQDSLVSHLKSIAKAPTINFPSEIDKEFEQYVQERFIEGQGRRQTLASQRSSITAAEVFDMLKDVDAANMSKILSPAHFKQSIFNICIQNLSTKSIPLRTLRVLIARSQIGDRIQNEKLIMALVSTSCWELVALCLRELPDIAEKTIVSVLQSFLHSPAFGDLFVQTLVLRSILAAHYSPPQLRSALQKTLPPDDAIKILIWIQEQLKLSENGDLKSETESMAGLWCRASSERQNKFTNDFDSIKNLDKMLLLLEILLDTYCVFWVQQRTISYSSLSHLASIARAHLSYLDDLQSLEAVLQVFAKIQMVDHWDTVREKKEKKVMQEQGRRVKERIPTQSASLMVTNWLNM